MELNTIKKELYKQKPSAFFYEAGKDGLTYTTGFGENTITFQVPLSEIGDVKWKRQMEAHLLIRWIVS